MISCERAAELISLSLETPLNWRQRFALRFHLCLCSLCRRFRRQMVLLQRAGRAADDHVAMDTSLPQAARDRISAAFRNAEDPGGQA